ncbi:hypothetical protein Acr_00g0024360 [Actinidia rufa]|uniref:Uncharacterized protein n=1 Tax=Actinidia rufa TaxID=165716 RepID=A0A7J0DD31_9ERIC|nr:hypothetical protein Acr_00g0024360 [Actinidia rufa]
MFGFFCAFIQIELMAVLAAVAVVEAVSAVGKVFEAAAVVFSVG